MYGISPIDPGFVVRLHPVRPPAQGRGAAVPAAADAPHPSTTRGSVGPGGRQADAASALGDDGRHVAFVSTATDLVPGDTNGVAGIFMKDLKTGAIARIGLGTGQADGASSAVALNTDGRVAAYASTVTDLVRGDTNGADDISGRHLG
ncbi:hypothetical protein ACFXDH_31320 [Streptomyces sp. NPDC059467]|uniref:hypothetical protein n=1 Tax=Streptomyces sp. NPDC059467 TaxID=3346844 RepID=UPI0036B30C50